MSTHDVIVIGAGGAGSATLFHLARQGVRVLGLDRFGPVHDRGSSHGQTRLIRQAYFEHPDYVPLLLRAYQLWRELEQLAGSRLLYQSGLLEVGPPNGIVLPGVIESAAQHGLAIDRLRADEVQQRFPGFVVPPPCQAVFETTAGILMVEACVNAHLEQAKRFGAELRFHEPVVQWQVCNDSVTVRSVAGSYSAARLVICGGAWSTQLMQAIGLPLRVVRKHLHWFENHDPRYHQSNGCPGFFFELPEGYYYGIPAMDGVTGVKAAEHSGGDEVIDPTALDRSLDPRERERVAAFLIRCAPGVSTRSIRHAVCMYTLTPDEHFILDIHPEYPQITFVAGLSGHGFKQTPVLGEALAAMTMGLAVHPSLSFLSRARFE